MWSTCRMEHTRRGAGHFQTSLLLLWALPRTAGLKPLTAPCGQAQSLVSQLFGAELSVLGPGSGGVWMAGRGCPPCPGPAPLYCRGELCLSTLAVSPAATHQSIVTLLEPRVCVGGMVPHLSGVWVREIPTSAFSVQDT